MFNKILIANRGEIACRIARTTREMGIQTIAIYSDVDHEALHTQLCDRAFHVGASSPSDSYLNADKIIQLAKTHNAQAIHPGYGFLSENSAFAQRCLENKIDFIGPKPSTISAMGAKSKARQLIKKAGLPVLPGYDKRRQDRDHLLSEATKITFPILIKAVAGGGGKGLRVVKSEDDFQLALEAVKRESLVAFGDDAVILERYLPDARHIEVQIFADLHGNIVHLFERDCSLQRRHQKVIEEAPAPELSAELREKLYQAAIQCAEIVQYIGAGTVEFLLAPDQAFYFMEMNTRLQVEHPVTEMITGIDLVEWQIRVAAGEALPCNQFGIHLKGHAIEARIYAESPEQGFLPSSGKIVHLRLPTVSNTVRVETGVREADEISTFYDPMIAKLICRGASRDRAFSRLHTSLSSFQLIGPNSNIRFLRKLCKHPEILQGGIATQFIENNLDKLLKDEKTINLRQGSLSAHVVAAVYLFQTNKQKLESRQRETADPYSPWAESNSWRIGENKPISFRLRSGVEYFELDVIKVDNLFNIKALDNLINANLIDFNPPCLSLRFDQHICHAIVVKQKSGLSILIDNVQYYLEFFVTNKNDTNQIATQNTLRAPMPGKLIACHVHNGQKVKQGEILMVLEAMKMEHSIIAPHPVCVSDIRYEVGDQVDDGAVLLRFEQ